MFACRNLIGSELKDEIEWLCIDTTASTNLHRPMVVRVFQAFKRIIKLVVWLIVKRRVDKVLIFTSNAFSFLEKGVMALICNVLFFKKVILAPRSGRITNDLKHRYRRKFIHLVFLRCEYVVCQGGFWKGLFLKSYPQMPDEKFVVIKNWIGIKKAAINVPLPERVEGQILFMGWLERDKGIFDLLKAAEILKDSGIKFKVIIAGEGRHRAEFEAEIDKLGLRGHVNVLGWVVRKKKQALFKSSGIFVLPSYFEGMPNALMEAMGQGLACVATNTGGIPDLIRSEQSGLLVNPGDHQGLARQLALLLDQPDLRRDMGLAAKKAILTNHSLDYAVKMFRSLLIASTSVAQKASVDLTKAKVD
jgi:glycosyltransferase involved in cell wall biosynthesis